MKKLFAILLIGAFSIGSIPTTQAQGAGAGNKPKKAKKHRVITLTERGNRQGDVTEGTGTHGIHDL